MLLAGFTAAAQPVEPLTQPAWGAVPTVLLDRPLESVATTWVGRTGAARWEASTAELALWAHCLARSPAVPEPLEVGLDLLPPVDHRPEPNALVWVDHDEGSLFFDLHGTWAHTEDQRWYDAPCALDLHRASRRAAAAR